MQGLIDSVLQKGQGLPAGFNPGAGSAAPAGLTPMGPGGGGQGNGMAGAATPPTMGAQALGPDRPERNKFLWAWTMGNYGPAAAKAWEDQELRPWRAQLSANLTRDLLEGRPSAKSISPAELVGYLVEKAPQALQDGPTMQALNQWVGTWNQEADRARASLLAQQKQGLDLAKTRAANLYQSSREAVGGAYLTPAQRAELGRLGYVSPGLGGEPPQPYGPGGDAGGIGNAGAATPPAFGAQALGGGPAHVYEPGLVESVPADESGKRRLFAGYVPGPGRQEAAKRAATLPLDLAKAGGEARAREAAQTAGFQERRAFDQANPAPQWATAIDAATGREMRVWTGKAASLDLGRPQSVGDLQAQVLRRGLQAAAAGRDPAEVLNPEEQKLYDQTLRSMRGDESLQALLALLGGGLGGQGGGLGLAAKAFPPGQEQDGKGLPPGARKAKDGNWYVKSGESWQKVVR